MFFILSKLLRFLTSPLTWILILAIYAIVTKRQSRRKIAAGLVVGSLLFFTNPLVTNLVMKSWEVAPVRYDELTKHQYGVILTGVTVNGRAPQGRTHYQKGADRVLHTVDLWKKGLIDKVVVTGGSGALVGNKSSEASNIRRTLLTAGVVEEDILLEEAARNTAENARNTGDLIGTDSKIVLITSAFHMRRANACFEKVGFETTPFATDYYAGPITWDPSSWLFPDTTSLHKWDVLTKEWVGYIVYKVRGYL